MNDNKPRVPRRDLAPNMVAILRELAAAPEATPPSCFCNPYAQDGECDCCGAKLGEACRHPAPSAPSAEATPSADRFDCYRCESLGVAADEEGCCVTCGYEVVVIRNGIPRYPPWDWDEVAPSARPETAGPDTDENTDMCITGRPHQWGTDCSYGPPFCKRCGVGKSSGNEREPAAPPVDAPACSEVAARGTHWSLEPGDACAGYGIIASGSLAPSTPPDPTAACPVCRRQITRYAKARAGIESRLGARLAAAHVALRQIEIRALAPCPPVETGATLSWIARCAHAATADKDPNRVPPADAGPSDAELVTTFGEAFWEEGKAYGKAIDSSASHAQRVAAQEVSDTAEAALRARLREYREALGPVPGGCRVLRYVTWEIADGLHRLAQPLVDHPEAGKLAKHVCDFLTPGAALARARALSRRPT